MDKLVIYYDFACPFAYLGLSKFNSYLQYNQFAFKLELKPFALGEVYVSTAAPQGNKSATTVMADQKKNVVINDLRRECARHGVPLTLRPPKAQAAALAFASSLLCPYLQLKFSLAVYTLVWERGCEADDGALSSLVTKWKGPQREREALAKTWSEFDRAEGAKRVSANSAEAVARGAFGAPSFWVCKADNMADGILFYGGDRMHFVFQALGIPSTNYVTRVNNVISAYVRNGFGTSKLIVYHDFVSPFSYLAYRQVDKLCKDNFAEFLSVPIQLHLLQQAINSKPAFLTNAPNKNAYMSKDVMDWAKATRAPFKFNSKFPLKTNLLLKLSICRPDLSDAIYASLWAEDKGLQSDAEIEDFLVARGMNASAAGALLAEAKGSGLVKKQLSENIERAKVNGVCGVPSFQVIYPNGDRSEIVWGQDRLHVAVDMLRGWRYTPAGQAKI